MSGDRCCTGTSGINPLLSLLCKWAQQTPWFLSGCSSFFLVSVRLLFHIFVEVVSYKTIKFRTKTEERKTEHSCFSDSLISWKDHFFYYKSLLQMTDGCLSKTLFISCVFSGFHDRTMASLCELQRDWSLSRKSGRLRHRPPAAESSLRVIRSRCATAFGPAGCVCAGASGQRFFILLGWFCGFSAFHPEPWSQMGCFMELLFCCEDFASFTQNIRQRSRRFCLSKAWSFYSCAQKLKKFDLGLSIF